MLEFRSYPTSDNPNLIGITIAAISRCEIGVLQKRNSKWVFIPELSVSFYDDAWLTEIVNKLNELNEVYLG